MYQIQLQANRAGKLVTLTKSLYPTKQEAKNAATQLRMISLRWTKSIRDKECERPNAPQLKWKFHGYIVTHPEEV